MGKASRRKKNAAPKRKDVPFVERPFEGLAAETDLVAMREFLPAATATLTYEGHDVQLVSFLPDALPGMRREDGTLVVALQTRMNSGDASRDIAHAIEEAAKLEPGRPLALSHLPEPGARLQDIVGDQELEVQVHDDFEFWIDPAAERTEELTHALKEAAEAKVPMVAVAGVRSAYWTRMGKEFLRWIRPEDESALLAALARLHHARQTELEEGARMIGAFRACGLLVPVWELVPGTEADELTAQVADFDKRLAAALAVNEPLSPEEKRARDGLISRQVNLR